MIGKHQAAGRDPGTLRLQAGYTPQPDVSKQSLGVCYWTVPRFNLWGGVIFFLKKLGILLHLLIDPRSNAQECGGAGESQE